MPWLHYLLNEGGGLFSSERRPPRQAKRRSGLFLTGQMFRKFVSSRVAAKADEQALREIMPMAVALHIADLQTFEQIFRGGRRRFGRLAHRGAHCSNAPRSREVDSRVGKPP